MFNAPIPGQSLTTTPRNTPYENPPQIAEPDKALAFHLDKLQDPKKMDTVMQLLENEVPLQTIVEGTLRAGVANGIHSIDVSLIIAPVLHEYIKGTADALGIDYDEGPDFVEEDDDEVQTQAGIDRSAANFKYTEDMIMDEPMAQEPAPVEEVPMEPKRGLMARPGGV